MRNSTYGELEVSSSRDGIQAIIDVAQRALTPQKVEAGGIYLVTTANGGIEQVDLTGPEYTGEPRRKSGTTTVRDTASFLAYYGKHADDQSEVYADVEKLTVTALLDAHQADSPRFGSHRLALALRQTKAWADWKRFDGQYVDQEEFANFLEDHVPDLVTPDAATMLEIAQSFKATTKAEFQSSSRLQSGERKFVYTEDTKASAGGRGELAIPEVFEIAVPPFEGAPRFKMTARLKYRLNGSRLTLGFKLEQPHERVAAAFEEIVKEIGDGIPVPILNGTPAA
ncbi:DUF2303 family protein [Streptomyces sp. NPDC096153]|uniref:DUF2303 family protein n=1 Tax=Streptomyces sp. NPDC096153 TaxID=3155548 RepID=UPI003322888B